MAVHASAADFTRGASFDTVASFVAAAQAFQPATGKGDLAALFTVRELGQPEDPKTGTAVVASAIQYRSALWDNRARIFLKTYNVKCRENCFRYNATGAKHSFKSKCVPQVQLGNEGCER